MQRRAVKTKHAPCRRPVRRVCRTGPLSTYCNATQQRNRARAQAASVVKKAAAAINTIGVWSGVVCRRSSSRSRCCSGNGVQRESVTGGRSFMIQTWPGPPSRRACVSSTRECGTSSALIPSMPARRTAFSCQVANNKTKTKPHGGGKEKDRPRHHDVPWLRARLALPWRRSKHPRTRSGARRHLDLQQRQSVQSRFSGDRVGETLLDPPSFFRTSSDFFPSHPPRFSDRSAVAWLILPEHALGRTMPSRQTQHQSPLTRGRLCLRASSLLPWGGRGVPRNHGESDVSDRDSCKARIDRLSYGCDGLDPHPCPAQK